MSQHKVIARLTGFALISAIEEDMREFLIYENSLQEVGIPSDIYLKVRPRIKADLGFETNEDLQNFSTLVHYLDFGDISKIIFNNKSNPVLGKDEVRSIATQIQACVPERNRICHSRPLNPGDFATLDTLARNLLGNSSIKWSKLPATLSLLKEDPRKVLQYEIPQYWQATSEPIIHNLPVADFEETGFIGREKDVENLKSLLTRTNRDVISIIGEGGFGKTSLALKTLFEIIEDDDNSFQMIIWVSLKNKALLGGGVREILNVIDSLSGTYLKIGSELGIPDLDGKDLNEVVEEIIRYMEEFKILIVLDNLEVTNTDALRPLLVNIKSGSKILITSRIGLMEIEYRFPVGELDAKSCINLARRYARFLDVGVIYSSTDEQLKVFSERLFNSPLLIKWFISSVKEGMNPKVLLDSQGYDFKQAIAFCFENLYERMDETDKAILKIMQAARHPLSRAELIYICLDMGLSQQNVEWSIPKLTRSSMVRMTQHNNSEDDGQIYIYSLTDLAAQYIKGNDNPGEIVSSAISSSLRKLTAEKEKTRRIIERDGRNRYVDEKIIVNNQDEAISAIYLKESLKKAKAGDESGALNSLSLARSLCPDSLYVHTIGGKILSDINRYDAEDEFQTALKLYPKNPHPYYCYALFCVRYSGEYERAILLTKKAIELDRNSADLKELYAFSLMRGGKYKDSIDEYEKLINNIDVITKKSQVNIFDRASDAYRRFAEDCPIQDRFDLLRRSIELAVIGIKSEVSDSKIHQRFWKSIDDLIKLARSTKDQKITNYICSVLIDIKDKLGSDSLNNLYRPSESFNYICNNISSEDQRKFRRAFYVP